MKSKSSPITLNEVRRRLGQNPGEYEDDTASALRSAAVLVPFLERNGVVQLLFTKRNPDLRFHGGEISFPGGMTEDGDRNLCVTALRETEEEIGLPPDRVEVLCALPRITTIFDVMVQPFAGIVPADYPWRMNGAEIEHLLFVPFTFLLHTPPYISRRIRHHDHLYAIRHYYYQDHEIWGATTRILQGLLTYFGNGALMQGVVPSARGSSGR